MERQYGTGEVCANGCRFVTGKRAGQPRPARWNEMTWSLERGWQRTGRKVCGICTEWGMSYSPVHRRR